MRIIQILGRKLSQDQAVKGASMLLLLLPDSVRPGLRGKKYLRTVEKS